MKVFHGPVFAEKVRPIEVDPTLEGRFELCGFSMAADVPYRPQIITRVEVVDPPLRRRLAVVPAAIGTLLGRRVAGSGERRIKVFPITRVLVHTTQQGRCKKVRVWDSLPPTRQWIGEPRAGLAFSPVKVIHDVLRRAHGHGEAPRVPALLISIQKGAGISFEVLRSTQRAL